LRFAHRAHLYARLALGGTANMLLVPTYGSIPFWIWKLAPHKRA